MRDISFLLKRKTAGCGCDSRAHTGGAGEFQMCRAAGKSLAADLIAICFRIRSRCVCIT